MRRVVKRLRNRPPQRLCVLDMLVVRLTDSLRDRFCEKLCAACRQRSCDCTREVAGCLVAFPQITLDVARVNTRKVCCLETRVKCLDALDQRWVSRIQAGKLRPGAEQHVTDFLRIGGFDHGSVTVATYLLQRIRDALRLPCELHSRRIGQVLALARNACLDDACEKHADGAEDGEAETDNQDYRRTAVTAAAHDTGMMTTADDQPANQRKHHDAEQDPHQPDVETHVAIEDMAELVRDHALKFVAVEEFERTSRHGNGRITGREAGSKRIDPAFLFEHIDLRYRHAGGNRHFLDDVAQPATQGIAHVGCNQRAAHLACDRAAARGQGSGFEHAGAKDKQRCEQRGGNENARIAGRELTGRVAVSRLGKRKQREADNESDARNDQ